MIFVDTSVWVTALRARDRAIVAALHALLDDGTVALAAPVKLELLSGAPRSGLPKLRRVLAALPVFYPARDTWALVESWIERAVRAGQRFGVADLLIAAVASERGGLLWSLDKDFVRLSRLKVVRLYAP